MSFLSWLNPINAIGKTINAVSQTFAGSKKDRDQQSHVENMGTLGQFAAEFRQISNRTWWDSLWDGINRMPRPVIAGSVIGYFYMSYFNPTEFQVLNTALATVPERMWWIAGAIVGFFFTARGIQKFTEGKLALKPEQFAEVQRRIKELRESEHIENDEYKRQMEDDDTPLTNKAIIEWNRRRKIK